MKFNVQLGESINNIKNAIKDLQNGKFVLIHDSDARENETDFIILQNI